MGFDFIYKIEAFHAIRPWKNCYSLEFIQRKGKSRCPFSEISLIGILKVPWEERRGKILRRKSTILEA